jgi:hypothetical protein
VPAPDEKDLTVIIYCSHDSPGRLAGLNLEICSVLQQHNVSDLNVEFIDGNVSRFATIPSYDKVPVLGSSISNSDEKFCGTLGLYLYSGDINGITTIYALTCHHVISNGIEPLIPAMLPPLLVNQPGNGDHISAVGNLQEQLDNIAKEIANIEEERALGIIRHARELARQRYQERLPCIVEQKASVDTFDRLFGRAVYSSGLKERTTGGRQLDWALIEVLRERGAEVNMVSIVIFFFFFNLLPSK